MNEIFGEYGKFIIAVISGIVSVGLMFQVFHTDYFKMGSSNYVESYITADIVTMNGTTDYDIQGSELIVRGAVIDKGANFNWKDYVQIKDDGVVKPEMIRYVSVSDKTIDTNVQGKHSIVYTFRWHGETVMKRADFYVKGDWQ